MKQNEIEKMCLWVLLVMFILIAIIAYPIYLGYVVLIAGILIPAYLLFKKR